MAIQKVYGITGFIEYTAEISVGRAHLSLHFVDGSITNYGVYPAKYRSKNAIEQAIIENSPLYKQGRITLLSTEEVADPVAEAIVAPVQQQPQQVKEEAKAVEEVKAPEVKVEEQPAETAGNATRFASLADAKEFLTAQGINVDGIRLKGDAIDVAKANGLLIEFTR